MKKTNPLLLLSLFLLLFLASAVNAQNEQIVAGNPITANTPSLVVTPSGDFANLRSGPGVEFDRIGRVNRGISLPVLEWTDENGGWYHVVQRSAQDAWVASWVVNVEELVSASQLVPATSTLYISLDTRPGVFNRLSMVERLDQMLTIFNGSDSSGTAHAYFSRLVQLLFMNPETNLDEIRPWLGDEVAVVNLQCLSSVMSEFLMTEDFVETPAPDVVVLAPILDRGYARVFLNKVLSSGTFANAPSREVSYQGFSFHIMNDPIQPGYNTDIPVVSMGIIDDFLVFAQGERAYNQIIDVANGGSSLYSQPGFQAIYPDLDVESMMRVFVSPSLFCPAHDPILYDALLSDAFRNGEVDLAEFVTSDPNELQDYLISMQDTVFQGYGVSFRNMEGSLELQLVSGVDREALQSLTGLSSQEVNALATHSGMELFGFLTPDTLEALMLGNISEGYTDLSMLAAEVPEDTFTRATGIPQDVFEWIDGSITMGFIDYPVFDANTESRPSYYLMVVESPRIESAQNAQAALIAAAQSQPNARSQAREVGTVQVTSITSDGNSGSNTLEVAMIDGYTVLVTGGNMERVIVDARRTADGRFVPDWQLLAGLPVNGIDAPSAEDSPFVAALDLSRMIGMGAGSRIQAAAIVTPPQIDGEPSRITIICSICRRGETCWPDR